MDKRMSNNHGFTMIEMLFVFFIILMLSTLTMTLHIPQKTDIHHVQDISLCLYQAKLNSMIHKETTDVTFDDDSLFIESEHYTYQYTLDQDCSFENYHFSYNDLGHIKRAKTVQFYGNDKNYAFVFQVGSGSFYVQ